LTAAIAAPVGATVGCLDGSDAAVDDSETTDGVDDSETIGSVEIDHGDRPQGNVVLESSAVDRA